ncbi:hypothetical protein PUN28_017153 [Cardiocondyla obscurior]|uniref:Uncharacterized protein n=1 Tax=Cardiocondyla obscurior TaxID=286306 RepID=A0AAW2EQD3_9HYME
MRFHVFRFSFHHRKAIVCHSRIVEDEANKTVDSAASPCFEIVSPTTSSSCEYQARSLILLPPPSIAFAADSGKDSAIENIIRRETNPVRSPFKEIATRDENSAATSTEAGVVGIARESVARRLIKFTEPQIPAPGRWWILAGARAAGGGSPFSSLPRTRVPPREFARSDITRRISRKYEYRCRVAARGAFPKRRFRTSARDVYLSGTNDYREKRKNSTALVLALQFFFYGKRNSFQDAAQC